MRNSTHCLISPPLPHPHWRNSP